MKKNKPREDNFTAVAAAVDEGRRQTVWELASVHGQSKDTIIRILSEDLGLVKRSARSVSELLIGDQKKGRVDKCNRILKLTWSTGLGVFDRIFTQDESIVSFFMPETKQQSTQWIKKGQLGPA
jgi:hypothetical protein